jgi:hypothetical protein
MLEKVDLETPPSKVEGGVFRVVKTPEGGLRSEAWRNGAWEPGGTVGSVWEKGRLLKPEELSSLGIG